jgi:hypothetical protein
LHSLAFHSLAFAVTATATRRSRCHRNYDSNVMLPQSIHYQHTLQSQIYLSQYIL